MHRDLGDVDLQCLQHQSINVEDERARAVRRDGDIDVPADWSLGSFIYVAVQ